MLGPVLADGKWIPDKDQRAILAVLALQAGEIVPYDVLIEALGGDLSKPSLQGRVRRLQARLAHCDIRIAGHRGTGCRLELAPDEVDALLLERLCAEGVLLAESGQWAEALGVFNQALNLYRSDPFSDTPSSLLELKWLQHLQDTWLRALRFRIRADIHLGRYEAAISTLKRLTTERSTEEIYWALLMLAEYRAGSRPAAKKTYQSARSALFQELDVDPGDLLEGIRLQIRNKVPPLDIPVP